MTFSERVLFCVGVEEDEHGAHGNHVEATRHLRKQQPGRESDVKCENVEKRESKDDQGNDEVEVLERIPELSGRGVQAPLRSAKLDHDDHDDYCNRSQNWVMNPGKNWTIG